MKDLDDFFESDAVDANVQEAEAEIETVETAETTEPEAPEIVETETVAETPQVEVEPDRSKWVPLTAVQAERDKVREKRDEIDRLNRELEAYRQAQQPTAQPQDGQSFYQQSNIPDPYDNPAGYHEFVMSQARQEMQLQNLACSRERALKEHGEQKITEVAEWASEIARNDPTFEARLLSQPDPAAWVIDQKKRADLLKSFEADPDAYVRNRAKELGLAEVPVEVSPVTTVQPQVVRAPVPSIATAKSQPSHPSTPKDQLDAFFK